MKRSILIHLNRPVTYLNDIFHHASGLSLSLSEIGVTATLIFKLRWVFQTSWVRWWKEVTSFLYVLPKGLWCFLQQPINRVLKCWWTHMLSCLTES